MPERLSTPPFATSPSVAVVLPTRLEELGEADQHSLKNIPAIFSQNKVALERELGATLELVEADPGHGARWLIGPSRCNPAIAEMGHATAEEPELFLDREKQL